MQIPIIYILWQIGKVIKVVFSYCLKLFRKQKPVDMKYINENLKYKYNEIDRQYPNSKPNNVQETARELNKMFN